MWHSAASTTEEPKRVGDKRSPVGIPDLHQACRRVTDSAVDSLGQAVRGRASPKRTHASKKWEAYLPLVSGVHESLGVPVSW